MPKLGGLPRPAATTITSTPTQVSAKTTATVSTRSQATPARVQVTASQMATPSSAARAINDVQTRAAAATLGARSSPLNAGPVIIQGIVFQNAVAQVVRHNLGRAYVGYLVVRSQGGADAVQLRDLPLPAGLIASQAVNFLPTNDGTADVMIF